MGSHHPQIVVDSSYASSASFESERDDDADTAVNSTLELDALLPEKAPLSISTTDSASNQHIETVSPLPKRRWHLFQRILGGLALLLCGVLLGSVKDLHRGHSSSPSADSASAHRTAVCNPYNLRGRLNVSGEASGTQWITAHNEPDCQVVDYMSRLQAVIGSEAASEDESLEFLRGKTVLFVGDSVDRNHLHHLCEQLSAERHMVGPDDELSPPYPPGEELQPDGSPWEAKDLSRPFYCHVKQFDLLLLNTFHFGFADKDEWYKRKGYAYCHLYAPNLVEDRIDLIARPLLDNIAQKLNRSAVPDIVSITAGFWDMQRTAYGDQYAREDAQAAGVNVDEQAALFESWRSMPDHLAEWHERRTEEVIKHIASLWSDAPELPRILWRVLHRTKEWGDIPASRRTAIDQLTRGVVDELIAANEQNLARRLFVNTWGDKIDGLELRGGFFKDSIHPGKRLSWLYGNMLFEELRGEVLLREREQREREAAADEIAEASTGSES